MKAMNDELEDHSHRGKERKEEEEEVERRLQLVGAKLCGCWRGILVF